MSVLCSLSETIYKRYKWHCCNINQVNYLLMEYSIGWFRHTVKPIYWCGSGIQWKLFIDVVLMWFRHTVKTIYWWRIQLVGSGLLMWFRHTVKTIYWCGSGIQWKLFIDGVFNWLVPAYSFFSLITLYG